MSTYAANGTFPSLLRVYNLLADPALTLDPGQRKPRAQPMFEDGFETGTTARWPRTR